MKSSRKAANRHRENIAWVDEEIRIAKGILAEPELYGTGDNYFEERLATLQSIRDELEPKKK